MFHRVSQRPPRGLEPKFPIAGSWDEVPSIGFLPAPPNLSRDHIRNQRGSRQSHAHPNTRPQQPLGVLGTLKGRAAVGHILHFISRSSLLPPALAMFTAQAKHSMQPCPSLSRCTLLKSHPFTGLTQYAARLNCLCRQSKTGSRNQREHFWP